MLRQPEAFPMEERVGVPGLVRRYCPILGRGRDPRRGQRGTRRENFLCSHLPLTHYPSALAREGGKKDTGP